MIYIYNNKNNTYRERLAYEINEHCSKNKKENKS